MHYLRPDAYPKKKIILCIDILYLFGLVGDHVLIQNITIWLRLI